MPLMFAYNTSVHSATKLSPHELTYGVPARTPLFSPDTQNHFYGVCGRRSCTALPTGASTCLSQQHGIPGHLFGACQQTLCSAPLLCRPIHLAPSRTGRGHEPETSTSIFGPPQNSATSFQHGRRNTTLQWPTCCSPCLSPKTRPSGQREGYFRQKFGRK